MRRLYATVSPERDGVQVRSILKTELKLSSSLVARVKLRETGILLNGVRAYTSAPVHEGDVVSVEVGDAEDIGILPVAAPISVLYEDEDIIIINKPAGMAAHKACRETDSTFTVENALAAYLREGENPHLVSRLDKCTTGAMTVAKSGYSHELMRRLQLNGGIKKTYLALATGELTPAKGVIDAPTGFAQGSGYKRAVREDGVRSVSEYEVLGFDGRFSLVRLTPLTGRMHQLRVHLAYVGHPLAGDWLYGVEDKALIARSALHSYSVEFVHPVTGDFVRAVAPVPEDMLKHMRGEHMRLFGQIFG